MTMLHKITEEKQRDRYIDCRHIDRHKSNDGTYLVVTQRITWFPANIKKLCIFGWATILQYIHPPFVFFWKNSHVIRNDIKNQTLHEKWERHLKYCYTMPLLCSFAAKRSRSDSDPISTENQECHSGNFVPRLILVGSTWSYPWVLPRRACNKGDAYTCVIPSSHK